MNGALPLVFNVAVGSGFYFVLQYFLLDKDVAVAAGDAGVFAVVYGAIQIGFKMYRKSRP